MKGYKPFVFLHLILFFFWPRVVRTLILQLSSEPQAVRQLLL